MDLYAFYRPYSADGVGRPAHEPEMMVALWLYAYCRGQRSSRVIERACVEDVAFRDELQHSEQRRSRCSL